MFIYYVENLGEKHYTYYSCNIPASSKLFENKR